MLLDVLRVARRGRITTQNLIRDGQQWCMPLSPSKNSSKELDSYVLRMCLNSDPYTLMSMLCSNADDDASTVKVCAMGDSSDG